MTSTATVQFIEDGFLYPPAQLTGQPMEEGRCRHLAIEGLHERLQFSRAMVALESASSEHLLVSVDHPQYSEKLRREIAAVVGPAFPSSSLSFVVAWSAGRSRVTRQSSEDPLVVAAAWASWMYCAAWDESDPIVVNVDGVAVAASVRFVDGIWHATVVEATPVP